jgi:hypothetical protein
MPAFLRWSVLAVPLLAMAGCSQPYSGPEVDGGYAPNGRARTFIDAQLAAHPDGTERGLTGDEATVIYRNYLRSIGGRPLGGGGQPGGGSLGSGAGSQGASAGMGSQGASGGTGSSYP